MRVTLGSPRSEQILIECSAKGCAFALLRTMVNTMSKPPRTTPKKLDHSPQGLRYALDQSGLKQAEFAAKMSYSEGMVSEWLKGTRNLTTANLSMAAKVLNCPRVVLEAKREDVA